MWMWLAHRWPLSAWACGEDATRWAITMTVGIVAGNSPFGVTDTGTSSANAVALGIAALIESYRRSRFGD